MIKLKLKIKFEDKTISETIYFSEDYNFSKNNPVFMEIINQKCRESGFEKPDTVTANIIMEL